MKNEHIGPSTSFSYSTFNMLNSFDGNDSETSEQTETFNSTENWGWIESPSSEDEYDPVCQMCQNWKKTYYKMNM